MVWCLALSINDEFVFRYENIYNIDSLVEQTAAVTSEVDDETFEVVSRSHSEESVFKFFGSVFCKLIKNDISYSAIEDCIIRNVIYFDFLTSQGLGDDILFTFAFYFKRKLGARLTFKQLAHLAHRFFLGIDAVYLHDSIARKKTCFMSREVLVRLRDMYIVIIILNYRTDAAIFAHRQKSHVFYLRFGNEDGIRV